MRTNRGVKGDERGRTFYAPFKKSPRPFQTKPGEPPLECVCAREIAPMAFELRFHGESYGWEAQFLERGELFISPSGFPLRALAIAWAQAERKAMEK